MNQVTVIMPVYNAMPFLPEAVESILRQTPAGAKLVIVDDCSTDGSQRYLEGLDASNIRVIRLPENAGPGVARNEGLRVCDTAYTAFMDSDDISLPGRLAAQLDFLERNPEIGLLGTQFTYLGSNGRTGFGGKLPVEHERIFENLKNGRHAIQNATVMARTSLLRMAGGYATSRCGEDWDLFLRAGEQARLANLDAVYSLYRLHRGSIRAQHLREERTQISYSIECAARREKRQPEISFGAFCSRQRQRPLPGRIAHSINTYALRQYHRALSDILRGSPVKGYARLAWAAFCAPAWALRRVVRTLGISPSSKRPGGDCLTLEAASATDGEYS